MAKSLLSKGALVVGAAVSLLALTGLVSVDQRPSQAFGRALLLLGLVAASAGLMLLWSTIIGLWSRSRMWSPQWTFLAAAMPFFLLAIWVFFFSNLEMRLLGYARMLLMVSFGSLSGRRARKKAYPQFSDNDSPSTPLPPPTLFPK
jgi:ABC-type transport system involved in multi-copper enzyme maturation permease subunit